MNPTRDVREKPRALAAVLFALCLLPMTTLALPPAVETDRLLLQAKTALDKANALSRDAASSNRDQALKEQYALAASAFEKAAASASSSSGATKVITSPVAPARAVRPARWM